MLKTQEEERFLTAFGMTVNGKSKFKGEVGGKVKGKVIRIRHCTERFLTTFGMTCER